MNRQEQIEALARKSAALERRIGRLERLEHAMSHNHGWDGSEWRKDPLRFGYSEAYAERSIDTGDGGGLPQDLATVPAGEVWVVETIIVFPASNDHTGLVYIAKHSGGTNYYVKYAPSLLKNTSLSADAPVVLEPGAFIRAYWGNAANGDSFVVNATGYKMLIAE